MVVSPVAEAVMDAIAPGADADGPSVVTDMLLDEDCEEGEEYNNVTNEVTRELRRDDEDEVKDDGSKFEGKDGDGGVIDNEEDGGGAMMTAEKRKTMTMSVVDQIKEAARRSSLSFLSTLLSSCLSSSGPPRCRRLSPLILREGARRGGGRGGRTPEPQRDPRNVRSPGGSSLRRKKLKCKQINNIINFTIIITNTSLCRQQGGMTIRREAESSAALVV